MPIPRGATDISSASQLTAVASALAQVSELCVDVEADSMHHFRARLCFVQVGTDTDIFLLDTLVPEVRADALKDAFLDPAKTKFFHAAMGDLQFLAEAGVRVRGLFDTHRAATLLGWTKVGLADLVLEKLGQTLQKEHQQADFSLRPLPPELRAYIADDVRYLTDVGRMVREACATAGILEEVELDSARMADEAAERPGVTEGYRIKLPRAGLSGAQVLLSEHLAKELHGLRLSWAEKQDLPMGRVLSNMAIQGIATRAPASARELARVPGVRGAIVREHGEELLELVKTLSEKSHRGELLALEEKKERDPLRRRREDALVAFRKEAAGKRKVTPSVVLPNALVEALLNDPPLSVDELAKFPYFGKKRLELHGDEVMAVLRRLG